MPSHTFGLQNSTDLLAKLRRELERFTSANLDSQSDHAFNFAITAWHIAEWKWKESRSRSGEAFGCRTFDEFHSKVRAESEALQICYELATGSKHLYLSERQMKSVASTDTKSTIGGGVTRPVTMPVTMPITTSLTGSYVEPGLVIELKSGGVVKPRYVFEEAIEYWASLTGENET